MRRSKANKVGDCWLCGHGWFYHFIFYFFIDHTYDPVREMTFEEFNRLDRKHRGDN